ncbi:MAG: hypothetical protein HC809_06740 [Gammaproteobacteria bacterium]|nr:hypothetical protein [Gammaproteobacteria bacterium]
MRNRQPQRHPQPRIAEFSRDGLEEHAIGVEEEADSDEVDEKRDRDDAPAKEDSSGDGRRSQRRLARPVKLIERRQERHGRSDISPSITQARLDGLIATGTLTGLAIDGDRITDAEGLAVTDCTFDGTSFQHAALNGARFKNCTFNACSFRSADLSDCIFERCRCYDTDTEATCDFSLADLRRARFEGCDLTTARFHRARAWSIELVNCQASGADFTETDFSLDRGNFAAATFDQCNLAYADFSATNLAECSLAGSRLVHANCRHTRFAGANLAGCALDNMDANGATLAGTDLRGASFNNLDPRTTDLTGARMDPEQGLLILRALGILIE